MPGVFLDLALLALLAGYALGGYRQGLLVSATSIVGFLGGGALGMAVLPPLLRGTSLKDKPAALALTTLFAVWVTAALGQYALRRLGVAAIPSHPEGRCATYRRGAGMRWTGMAC